jgi:cell division FtsZ-interacting protein ZapD
MEQKEYARMFPAKTNLEAAVQVQKEKLYRNHHVAAHQAVDRSLEEVDEVIQGGDAAEIEDLHRQLEKQREAMTATAVHVGVHQLEGIAGVQANVNKSLRRLTKARRDLQKGTNAGSLFSPAASDGGGGGEDNAQPPRFQLPPAD